MDALRLARLGLFLFLAACGGATATAGGGPDPLAPATLYPLRLGNVWSYNIDTGTESPTLSVTRVIQVVGTRVEVSSNGGEPAVYEIRPEGIYRPASSTFLLQAPIRAGAEWPAPQGATARVTSTTEAIDVDAGHFERCVRIEESGGPTGGVITTVYCPEVGPVLVESTMPMTVAATPARVVGRLLGYMFE